MKLREWLKNLNEQAGARPEMLEMEMVTSTDDEGSGYNQVSYTASVGWLDEDGDFTDDIDGDDIDDECEKKVICLN